MIDLPCGVAYVTVMLGVRFPGTLDDLRPGFPFEGCGQARNESGIEVLAPAVVEIAQLIACLIGFLGLPWIERRQR